MRAAPGEQKIYKVMLSIYSLKKRVGGGKLKEYDIMTYLHSPLPHSHSLHFH